MIADIKHGTRSGYQRGCRCAGCTEAQREYGSAYWKTNAHKYKKVTLSRPTAGVMHESESEPESQRVVPEETPAIDTSFASWAKRRVNQWADHV